MPRTTLTKTTAPGSYSHAGVALTMTAADVGNGNQFVASGKDLVVVHNPAGLSYTVTVTSSPDAYGRTKDITTETVTAGQYKIFGPFEVAGWIQTDGKIYLSASNAGVLLGIVAL